MRVTVSLMRIRIIGLVLLAILAASQADRALAQEVSSFDRFKLFNECRPMHLIVESLPADAAEIDLAKASIQVAVESRLRSARLFYDFDSESTFGPYLYVNVNVVGRAFNTSLEYNKQVHDLASDVTSVASMWDISFTGTHGGSSNYILSTISELMDRFLVEYLRVNEAACK